MPSSLESKFAECLRGDDVTLECVIWCARGVLQLWSFTEEGGGVLGDGGVGENML